MVAVAVAVEYLLLVPVDLEVGVLVGTPVMQHQVQLILVVEAVGFIARILLERVAQA
jgi:hypothetical protein